MSVASEPNPEEKKINDPQGGVNPPAYSGRIITRRDLVKWVLGATGTLLASPIPAFGTGATEPSAAISWLGPDGLRAHGNARNLLVGSSVVVGQIQADPAFRELLQNQASILVSDWQMKWNALRPSPNEFYFADADWLVSYAQASGQKLRGHNLCWYQALPTWFSSYATTANARDLLMQHIWTVVTRYAGKIHSWDVVNEATDPGQPDGLRVAPWVTLAGSDYVDLAFRTARQADPHALLTYNENGVETEDDEAKRACILKVVGGMKQRGVPIDAVGIQSHLNASNTNFGSGLVQFIRELAALGLQVFITELDVNDESVPGNFAQRDAAVASVYASYLNLVLPEPNVTALLTWEERDPDSWLRGIIRSDGTHVRPLPFDGNYQPKPAFLAMRDAVDQCPVK
jgi:endo-1,4-beta-xylanase